jgi:hypothetical protein
MINIFKYIPAWLFGAMLAGVLLFIVYLLGLKTYGIYNVIVVYLSIFITNMLQKYLSKSGLR